MHLCVEDTLTHCPQDLLVSYNLKAYGMMIPGLDQEFNATYTSAWCRHSVLLLQLCPLDLWLCIQLIVW